MPWGRTDVKRPVTVVIPARYGSSRFPGKPLVELMGKPMIQHVYEQAKACRVVDEVLVATDDERIKAAVEQFGGKVLIMTEPYRTGTDRVAAVAQSRTGGCFVDLQGDEILLHPDLITDLGDLFKSGDSFELFDYSEVEEGQDPGEQIGVLVIGSVDTGPQMFEKQSGIRLLQIEGKVIA